MRQTLANWMPAIFCLLISFPPARDWDGWRIQFLSFLPVCFVFVAIVLSQMQHEVRRLRQELVELKRP